MALTKITPDDLAGKGVVGLAAVPGLDAPEMQQKFDELATDLLVPKHNELVDELLGAGGAAQIGTAAGGTVEGALAALVRGKADAAALAMTDAAIAALQAGKADAADVLTKDNTQAYTPSAAYHPATKQYVDTIQIESGAGDMTKAVYDPDGDGSVALADRAAEAANAICFGGQEPGFFGKAPARFTAAVGTSWTGTAAPYTQTVAVEGLLASDWPHVAPIFSEDAAAAQLEKEAWSLVRSAQAADGGLCLLCDEEKPTSAFVIQIEVMR